MTRPAFGSVRMDDAEQDICLNQLKIFVEKGGRSCHDWTDRLLPGMFL